MLKAEKGIRFIDSGYNDRFTIPDGGKIRINFSDGTSEEKTCRYIDDTHVQFGDGSGAYGLQHICEFAERLENICATVEPVTEPMVKLTERFAEWLDIPDKWVIENPSHLDWLEKKPFTFCLLTAIMKTLIC